MKMLVRAALALSAVLPCAPVAAQSPVGLTIKAPAGFLPGTAIYCDDGTGHAVVCASGGGGGGGGDASAANQVTLNNRIGDLTTPATGTLLFRLNSILTALGSPYQAGGALPLPSGASTAANQASTNTKLDQLHTDMIAPTPAGSNLIGRVGIDQATSDTLNTQSAAPGSTAATIASGGSITGDIDLAAQRLHRIHIPAAGWTAAAITFQVSFDGAAWADLYDLNGEVSVPGTSAQAGRSIVIDQSVFYGVRWIRLRSGTSAAPVAQAAARNLTLVTVAR